MNGRSELHCIVIEGGLTPNGHEDFAQFGDVFIERVSGETVEAFRERARSAALVAGSDRIVFGGLPPMRTEEGAP
jgi:hypothetical protein